MNHGVGLSDVFEAKRAISPYLRDTPLYLYPALCERVGTDVLVKHENHQPICTFKVRGGVNLVSRLSDTERERGVIAASTGNHGQSVAYASSLFGVDATICVPENPNPVKVASMKRYGATIIEHGADFDDAREHCEKLAEVHDYRYIHSGNEPLLIAGVGTYTLEILQERPDVDVIIVPVGGGSGAAGASVVASALGSGVEVIGVQSEAAPAAFLSWKKRSLVEDRMDTFAEGLATRTAFDLPQRIMWDLLDDFVLVSDEEIRRAMLALLEGTRNLVEAAGAAAFAAAVKLAERLAGKTVVVICSGGNISPTQLKEILDRS